MKVIKPLSKGIVLMVVVASILLFSDLRNSNYFTVRKHHFIGIKGLKAVAGHNYSIGISYFAPEAGFENVLRGLFDGLHDLGFVRDSNLTVIMSHANGEIANIPTVLQSLDNQPVDLIIPTSTPCLTAALAIVKNKKMVFTYVYDPIAAGAGTSYQEHQPNVTGVGSFPPIKETIDLITTLLPGTKSVGTIYNSSEANSRKAVSVAKKLFSDRGIDLKEVTVTSTNEVIQAAQVIVTRGINALWITGDNTAIQAIDGIIKTATAHNIPVILNDIDFLKEGALAVVGIGWYGTGYHTAQLVARVLNGENPDEIPIENYVEQTIAVNEKVAAAMHITIPREIEKLTSHAATIIKPTHKLELALIHFSNTPFAEEAEKGILDGLSQTGMVKDQDYHLETFNAQGQIDNLNSIANTVAAGYYDYILLTSTPALEIMSKKAGGKTILFTCVADPVQAGVAEDADHHFHNITGISTMSDFDGMIRLIKGLMPSATKIGTLFCPAEDNSVIYRDHLQKAAAKEGLQLEVVPVNQSGDVPEAVLALTAKKIDAVCQISDNLTAASFPAIAAGAGKANLPVFGFISEQIHNGALAVVSRDFYQSGRDVVVLLQELIAGTSPRDIPIQKVSKTKIIISPSQIKKLKIDIPSEYMQYILPEHAGWRKQGTLHFAAVQYSDSPLSELSMQGIRDGLSDHGLLEGRDYTLEMKSCQGDISTLNTILNGIKASSADLVFTISTPVLQGTINKIKDKPIVFTTVADPVIAGAGKSFTDHLPNVTGISTMGDYKKMCILVKDLIPHARKIGTLYTPGEANSVNNLKTFRTYAAQQGFTIEAIAINSTADVTDATLTLCSSGVSAICQIIDNLTSASFAGILQVSRKTKVPLFGFVSTQVEQGAILGISRDYYQGGKDAVNLAVQILEGINPADIPFQFVSKTNVMINLKAADYYGLTIPDEIINSADIIIGRNKK
jgi:ABC-type uncharacterized transport system substrate-binding protein